MVLFLSRDISSAVCIGMHSNTWGNRVRLKLHLFWLSKHTSLIKASLIGPTTRLRHSSATEISEQRSCSQTRKVTASHAIGLCCGTQRVTLTSEEQTLIRTLPSLPPEPCWANHANAWAPRVNPSYRRWTHGQLPPCRPEFKPWFRNRRVIPGLSGLLPMLPDPIPTAQHRAGEVMHFHLSHCLYWKGKHDQAIEWLTTQLLPNDPNLHDFNNYE